MRWLALISFFISTLLGSVLPCAHAHEVKEHASADSQKMEASHHQMADHEEPGCHDPSPSKSGRCGDDCNGGSGCAGCPLVTSSVLPTHHLDLAHSWSNKFEAEVWLDALGAAYPPDVPPPKA